MKQSARQSAHLYEHADHHTMFDVFRQSNMDIDFIKRQIYGKACVLEKCPSFPDLSEILARLRKTVRLIV